MPDIVEIWDAELGYSHTTLSQPPYQEPAQPVLVPDGSAEPLWGVYLVNSAGENGIHVFPNATLEWRSAEHAIDPDDVDTLLDVVLHEGGLPDRSDPLAYQDPGALAVIKATAQLPTTFTPGVSPDDRRAACLRRIAAVKQHRFVVTPAAQIDRQAALMYVGSTREAPADPLAPIRDTVRLDPARVAAKRAFLDWQRQSVDQPAAPNFFVKPPATFVGMQPPGRDS
ncbi:hypothetical protein [Nonomuraea wenchangensis]|uniref:hypothetical protein n=1 Tax=Nonomuraea wenchangensis TaxID=568860 RepID=UPI003329F187